MARKETTNQSNFNWLSRVLSLISIIVLISPLFTSCEKDESGQEDHKLLDPKTQQTRVDYPLNELDFERFDGMKGDPGDYTFTVVANIAPPSISGTPVQACYLHADGSKIYVTYNLKGEEYKGAVDIYTYALDPVNTTLTAAYSMEFPNSDINCVASIPNGADSYEVFLVGSTQGYTGSGLSSPAFMIYFDPTLTSYGVLDLPGYVANAISFDPTTDWFSTSSGSNGGLTILDRAALTSGDYLAKANLTAVCNVGDYVYQISTDPSNLGKYQKNTTTDQLFALTGYASDPDHKSTIAVKYGHSFVALNQGGTVVFNNTTNAIVENLTPANPGGVPAEYLVSNGLCVGDYRLFMANGGGGLTLAELDLDMNINVIGNVVTDQSVNHVVMLQEGGNSGYLAMVSGKAGLKIVYYTYSGTAPTITTTTPSGITETSAASGGEVTANGGTVVSARGVCWSTSSNPTIADNKTTDGDGNGSFTSSITGLTESTTYYVRAYATNNVGTSYGNQESFTTASSWVCGDPFTDARDGTAYETVAIGGQCWMAENLAYLPEVSSSVNGSYTDPYYYVSGYEGSIVSTAIAEANYSTYGVLYNWPASLNACPDGWHLPTDAEWTLLINYLTNNAFGYEGSGDDIAKSMASASGWTASATSGSVGNDQSSNNTSGFTALPGGFRDPNSGFQGLGVYAPFWSSSESGSSDAWSRILTIYNSGVVFGFDAIRNLGFSVRCLRD